MGYDEEWLKCLLHDAKFLIMSIDWRVEGLREAGIVRQMYDFGHVSNFQLTMWSCSGEFLLFSNNTEIIWGGFGLEGVLGDDVFVSTVREITGQ